MRAVAACAAGLVLAACQSSTPGNAAERHTHPASVATRTVELRAADGVTVFGTFYPAPRPKAVILLFHQAGSSSGEYATIAPRLVEAGYSALAIDQRSGGGLFGINRTARAFERKPQYLDAKPDLEAALAWAKGQGKPAILWGSSYSAALVFLVAAEHPGEVTAVMAFSPGEYLGRDDMVREAAAKVTAPIFVTSAKDSKEIAEARAILNGSAARTKVAFVPKKGGVHGSSTLIEAKNKTGADENWEAVLGFLREVAP